MSIVLFEARQMVAKIESTYGTDATPVGSTDSLLVIEGAIAVQADKLERNIDRATFGANPFVLVGKRVQITGTIELVGSATAGNSAPISPMLRACAMSETLVPTTSSTFAPVTTGTQSLTVYFSHGPYRYAITGCRGTLQFSCNVKGYYTGQFTLTGRFALPTVASISGFTIAAFQNPPPVETETFSASINSVVVECLGVEWDLGNQVVIHEDSESREVAIMERAVTGTIKIGALESLASLNPWSLANAHTLVTITFAVNGGATKIITTTFPTAQIELPAIENMEGRQVLSIPFVAAPNAGNDEFSIAFT